MVVQKTLRCVVSDSDLRIITYMYDFQDLEKFKMISSTIYPTLPYDRKLQNEIR
jgi:hypothetical protein